MPQQTPFREPVQSSLAVVERSAAAAALLSPARQRLLEAFRVPRSAAEAARLVGLPRQRVGYHVRELKARGFLVPTGERRRGAFVEQLLQTSARAYLIAPQGLGPMAVDEATVKDRFSSAYLLATAARTIRDLAALRCAAAAAEKRLPTLTLETEVRFASPAAQSAFAEKLAARLAELAAEYHDEESADGRRFRFTLGAYPTPAAEKTATEGTNPKEDETHDDSAQDHSD